MVLLRSTMGLDNIVEKVPFGHILSKLMNKKPDNCDFVHRPPSSVCSVGIARLQ